MGKINPCVAAASRSERESKTSAGTACVAAFFADFKEDSKPAGPVAAYSCDDFHTWVGCHK